jgi:hypothetical protein
MHIVGLASFMRFVYLPCRVLARAIAGIFTGEYGTGTKVARGPSRCLLVVGVIGVTCMVTEGVWLEAAPAGLDCRAVCPALPACVVQPLLQGRLAGLRTCHTPTPTFGRCEEK